MPKYQKEITDTLNKMVKTKKVKLTGTELKYMVPYILSVSKKLFKKDFQKIVKITREKDFVAQSIAIYRKLAEKDVKIQKMFTDLIMKVLDTFRK